MDAVTITGGRTPWHLWLVGGLALLWNAFGAYDYLMTQTHNAAYLAQFTPEQRAYFASYPVWMVADWAIGVWGGLLGAILLLMKKRWAYPVFVVSLAAFLISVFYTYALSNGAETMDAKGTIISVVIAVFGVIETVYAREMSRRGVLR